MSQPPKPPASFNKPRGLGRGLSALLGDHDVASAVAPMLPPRSSTLPPAAGPSGGGSPVLSSPGPSPAPMSGPRPVLNRTPLTLPTAFLRPGKYQPRTTFEVINVLVDSIRQFGLLQPILVRPVFGEPDAYEIIAGERRWRAAQLAKVHDVPVVIRSLDDLDALQLALVENLQRADLSPVDEAQGYRRLMTDFNQTQEEVARTMGRSRPHIANTLRLLDLPANVKDMIRRDEISAGHGRALLAFPNPEAMAERVISDKLTVRDLEKLAAENKKPAQAPASASAPPTPPVAPDKEPGKTADTDALERRIEEALGLKVSLALRGTGEHSLLTLEIGNFDQLDMVVERLTRR